MKVVRAILGRFARFLVRIARTLDPALGTAPYWVMPERMAALRQRYPGAPEHWLEFLARRAAIGEPASSHVPPAEPRETLTAEPPQPRARPPRTWRTFLGIRDRPPVAFPRPNSRPGPRPGTARIAHHVDPARPAAPSSVARAPTRPALKFSTSSVRNPIANLLRIARPEARLPVLHFHEGDKVLRESREAAEPEALIRREHRTVFPDQNSHPPHRADWIGPSDVRSDSAASQSEIRWPSRADRSSSDPSWPNQRSRASRPDPGFRMQDPRWPDLPPSPAENGPSPSPSLDEAILLAEQIGGSWSG